MPGFRCSSLRLGSDNRACVSWLAPTANSLGVQLTTDPLRLSLSFNLLESYHSFLKLSTTKCACQGKMFLLDARGTISVIARPKAVAIRSLSAPLRGGAGDAVHRRGCGLPRRFAARNDILFGNRPHRSVPGNRPAWSAGTNPPPHRRNGKF